MVPCIHRCVHIQAYLEHTDVVPLYTSVCTHTSIFRAYRCCALYTPVCTRTSILRAYRCGALYTSVCTRTSIFRAYRRGCACVLSHLVMPDSFATPCTVAHQAPLSMEFLRQEYWSGFPFPTPGNFPVSGIEPTSPALACRFFTTEPPRKPRYGHTVLWPPHAKS